MRKERETVMEVLMMKLKGARKALYVIGNHNCIQVGVYYYQKDDCCQRVGVRLGRSLGCCVARLVGMVGPR